VAAAATVAATAAEASTSLAHHIRPPMKNGCPWRRSDAQLSDGRTDRRTSQTPKKQQKEQKKNRDKAGG